ncbi:SDR family oxidoreductase [Paenibacillus polymyxa]|uniref:SDR family oxidoreductase n=1 Tax=Paenibacillus polymyxa TaxID=1406 RepID=A0AAE9L748_PAEPO|nr:SDR family oxidoreductase [Paenibacillus polymyxa]URJ39947.1 SDR family oxidoreductase [Paenibacillus polymyxa]URJ49206.1 SDR family oxidoreductase [Paenibacillus polymyxa]
MQDKVIIITGASSGIGKATAKLLAHKGAKIVAGARRRENLEELVSSIQATGGTATFQVTDVTQRGDVENLVQHAVDMYGKVDVIINNAGVMPLSTMDKLKVDEWEKMISVNINGVLYGIAAALPVMQKQGYGHIINTSSTAGHVVEPTAAVYAGTKFAVRAISEGLRKESGGKIKVTVISPGVTETELGQDITDETSAAGLKEIRKTALPPEVIADAIAYAIDQPSYVDVSEVLVRELGRI